MGMTCEKSDTYAESASDAATLHVTALFPVSTDPMTMHARFTPPERDGAGQSRNEPRDHDGEARRTAERQVVRRGEQHIGDSRHDHGKVQHDGCLCGADVVASLDGAGAPRVFLGRKQRRAMNEGGSLERGLCLMGATSKSLRFRQVWRGALLPSRAEASTLGSFTTIPFCAFAPVADVFFWLYRVVVGVGVAVVVRGDVLVRHLLTADIGAGGVTYRQKGDVLGAQ